MKKQSENEAQLTNQCPCCKANGTLVLYVDAYDTSFDEDDDEYDTYVHIGLNENLKVIKTRLPKNVETYDKDRYILCTECGADSTWKDDLLPIRSRVREINPSFL